MSAKAPAKGQTKKHALSASAKHAAHVKHEAHLAHMAHLKAIGRAPKVTVKAAPAKPAKAAKARSFAIGDLLPVCAFEAVAQSLRLAGQRVHPDDVAQLWWLAGADEDGASVVDALAAAALFGLVGCRPSVRKGRENLNAVTKPVTEAGDGGVRSDLVVDLGAAVPRAQASHPLILGIDVPGPHCVLATPRGWWSWGELHSPWPCRVEEAWAVSWS